MPPAAVKRAARPAGYLSWRSHVWTDVDPDRTGTLPFVWEANFGFESYVEYALDVPMYFLYRDGVYQDATQQRGTFRDFLEGRLYLAPGAPSTHAPGGRGPPPGARGIVSAVCSTKDHQRPAQAVMCELRSPLSFPRVLSTCYAVPPLLLLRHTARVRWQGVDALHA